MQSFDFKKFLPHILIIVGFLIVSILFSMPAYKGMILSQSDNISWKAMSQEAKTWHEKTGENTLWSNSMFGGMPTYTYYIPKTKNYVGDALFFIQGLFNKPAYFFFYALVCFYILASVLNINRWLGIIGSVAFAFSSYNAVIIGAGHDTKMISIALAPAVIAGVFLLYRGRYLLGVALYTFMFAWFFGKTHYQIIFYVAIIIFFVVVGFLIESIRKKNLKTFIIASVIMLVASVLAVGPSAASVWTTVLEYNKETMRGGTSELTGHDEGKKSGGLDKDYAFQWSNGVGETLCIMIPYLYGGSGDEPGDQAPETLPYWMNATHLDSHLPMYWGPQPFLSGPVYFGAIICFLFVLGIMVIRNNVKWWLLGASVLGVLLSLGNHFPEFNYWFFDNIPFYNKFRTPSMALTIPEIIFPIVAIWGLMEVVNGAVAKDELWKKIKIAAGATAGICLLVAIAGSAMFDFTNPQTDARYGQLVDFLKQDRASLAMKSAITSAVYILLAAALLWAFVKSMIKKEVMIAGVGLLIAIDLISVSNHYLNEDNYQDEEAYESQNFVARPVDKQILQDPDPYYRVLDVTKNVYNDAHQAYFHKCIGGYSPAKLELYQDLIDRQLSNGFNSQVLNMLNTKYVIYKVGDQEAMQPLPTACGNAWFVNEIKWAQTADEEMASLNAPNLGDTTQMPNAFQPLKTAVIRDNKYPDLKGFQPQKDSSAYVRLAQYGLNTIKFESENSKDGLAVFSDIYYPHGWVATIDGTEVPIYKADYLLRALKIPAGKHQIVFNFHPRSYYMGDNIAMVSSIILYGLVITAIVFSFRRKKETDQSALI